MTSSILVYGLQFNVETAGFRGAEAEADKERGVDFAEAILRGRSVAEVAALHAADLAWVIDDCAASRPEGLGAIEAAALLEATDGWHNPSAASISISAVPGSRDGHG